MPILIRCDILVPDAIRRIRETQAFLQLRLKNRIGLCVTAIEFLNGSADMFIRYKCNIHGCNAPIWSWVDHRDIEPAYIHEHGYLEWYQQGMLHREDGPARIEPDKKEWYKFGFLHREDGPAHVSGYESIWYQYGQLHREDGPAIISTAGGESWYLHGKQHRVGAPAIKRSDGTLEYYMMGKRHRTDGPAVIRPYGRVEYWINGKPCRGNH